MAVIASAQITIVDTNDIWVVDEEPQNVPDKTIIFIPSKNVMKQYDALSDAWQVIADHDSTKEEIDNVDQALANVINATVNDADYQNLIGNKSNTAIIYDLIAAHPYLTDALMEALDVDPATGTTLKSISSLSDCSIHVGKDEVALMKALAPFMTVSALKATLPPSVQIGDTTTGSKFRAGVFTFEHQMGSGNLTIRKV